MHFRKMLFVLVCSILLIVAAQGQSTNASLSGQITDTQDLVIVAAEVQAVNEATGVVYSAKTNGEGFFSIPDLPPGAYELRISKTGFRTMLRPGITLHVQDSRALNATLQVGDAAEIVRVEGGISPINTQDASVSTTIDRNFAENLPLNGRSFQTLVLLTPGTVLTTVDPVRGDGGQFSVNGQRSNTNNFMVDGVSANGGGFLGSQSAGVNQMNGANPNFTIAGTTQGMVSVDALQEFKIQTSTYAPEFGRQPGGQVSLLTRSGTNDLHGTAFDYLRNDIFDANDWFNDAAGLPKGKERQNDFGGTLGGPISRDRTFFFFSYEGLRLLQPFTNAYTVPSLSLRQQAAPVFQPFMNYFPFPNGPDFGNGGAQYTLDASQPTNFDAYSIRIDQTFRKRLHFFGRYYDTSSKTELPGGEASDNSIQDFRSRGLTLGTDILISPTTHNELRLNYSNGRSVNKDVLYASGGGKLYNTSLLYPAPFLQGPDNVGWVLNLPNVQIGTTVGPFGNNTQRLFNIIDNASIVIGAHQVKVGMDYRRLFPTIDTFRAAATYYVNSVGDLASGTISQAYASALGIEHPIYTNFSAYAQDTWKLSNKLTLTYGLRWELNPTPGERDGLNRYFLNVIGPGNPATATVAPPGSPVYKTTYYNFAPRIGVAYQLRQKPGLETVIRSGFGVFFDLNSQTFGQGFEQGAFGNSSPPVNNLPFPVPDNALTIPPVPTPWQAPYFALPAIDPNLQLPYTLEWNLSIEQSLGSHQSLTASYVASAGERLLQQAEFANFSSAIQNVYALRNGSSSNYQSLQLQFNRHFRNDLQALASYTYSHSIDNASNSQTIYSSTAGGFPDPNANRGNSDFDLRHAFRGALTYNIPTWKTNFISRSILGRWSVDAIGIAQSALPIDLQGGFELNYFATARPDIVPGIPLYVYGSQYPGGKSLNNTPNQGGPGCSGPFCPPPTDANGFVTRQGTFGRNVLRGFGIWQTDFAIHRQFNLSEHTNLQFRGELFNIFNHPNFSCVDTFVGDGSFGQARCLSNVSYGGLNSLYQIGGPRSIQVALKLLF